MMSVDNQRYQASYKQTMTTKFFFDLNRFVYVFGLPSFWIGGLDLPSNVTKIYNKLSKLGNILVIVLVFSELGAFLTQKHLTDKQKSDLIMFFISHLIITMFRVKISYMTDQICDVTYTLGVTLKDIYNDLDVEKAMIKKSKFYSSALIVNCLGASLMFSVEAIFKALTTDATFTTVITVYPDTLDLSLLAKIMRIVFFLFWWIFVSRIFSVYTIVICLTNCLSHQFRNLNSYFYSLNKIFDRRNQEEMEEKYERALKVGFMMHSQTLRCGEQIQTICRDVFSGQIIFNVMLLIIMMNQMAMSERNFTNMFTIVAMALTILLSTGFFMWNAGDITIEADSLPTAIYSSGWQNCQETSVRVRNLIVIAMGRAQKPVVLTGILGIIKLSYSAYVSIVKSSYSVFSVIY